MQHAFLLSLTSVPELETYTMLLARLGLMGFVTSRRKTAEIGRRLASNI
jgi:hypothetical protein